jgi:hypothetical protein
MSEDTTTHSSEPSGSDEMWAEYDFSTAKPGRHRGKFHGQYIRVMKDGTEQTSEPEAWEKQ